MAYFATAVYSATPRVSSDQGFIRIRVGDHSVLGLSRREAATLAADILDALQVSRFESVEAAILKPLTDVLVKAAQS